MRTCWIPSFTKCEKMSQQCLLDKDEHVRIGQNLRCNKYNCQVCQGMKAHSSAIFMFTGNMAQAFSVTLGSTFNTHGASSSQGTYIFIVFNRFYVSIMVKSHRGSTGIR